MEEGLEKGFDEAIRWVNESYLTDGCVMPRMDE